MIPSNLTYLFLALQIVRASHQAPSYSLPSEESITAAAPGILRNRDGHSGSSRAVTEAAQRQIEGKGKHLQSNQHWQEGVNNANLDNAIRLDLTPQVVESNDIRQQIYNFGNMYPKDYLIWDITRKLLNIHEDWIGSAGDYPRLVKGWRALLKLIEEAGRLNLDRNHPLVRGRLIFIASSLVNYLTNDNLTPPEVLDVLLQWQRDNFPRVVKSFVESEILFGWLESEKPTVFTPTIKFLMTNRSFKPLRRSLKALDDEGEDRVVFAFLCAMMEFLERERNKWNNTRHFFHDFFRPFLKSKDPYGMIQKYDTWDKMIKAGSNFFQQGNMDLIEKQLNGDGGRWHQLELVTVYFFLKYVKNMKKENVEEASRFEDYLEGELDRHKKFTEEIIPGFKIHKSRKVKNNSTEASKKRGDY
ncbi:hypothetical protein PtB15_9B639 [Puccinia triticina]|nr:hypothetical protein PtB15_9B639 [Puccinia triticina]